MFEIEMLNNICQLYQNHISDQFHKVLFNYYGASVELYNHQMTLTERELFLSNQASISMPIHDRFSRGLLQT